MRAPLPRARILALAGAAGLLALPRAAAAFPQDRVARAEPTGDSLSGIPDDGFLRRGLELRTLAGPEAALVYWEEAWEELASRGIHDPRIGVAFMETASGLEDEAWRERGSRIFLWGFTTPLVDGSRVALEAELDRILPLVSEDDARRWETLRSGPDDALAREIKRFWIERDPTPATPLNERLFEHWERIRHAREKFTYNRMSPIGTDARGTIYLRYGEPARVARGSLGASEHELQIRVPRDREARIRLRQYDPNPQYEVWVYERLNDEGFTYFLFGNRDGTGPFDLVDGVHELILPAARSESTSRYTPGGIPASNYLELFYYQDLSRVGGHFGKRFSELDQLWNDYTYRSNAYVSASRLAPSESEIRMYTDRYRQEDEFFPPAQPLSPVESEFEGRARDELVGQAIRILSDAHEPLLVVVGASAPRLAADRRAAYAGRLDVPGWTMQHSLIIRDGELEEVGRLDQPLDPSRADVSSFTIRHVPEPLHLTLTARTLIRDSTGAEGLMDSGRLPGQFHIVPGEPLDPSRDRFEVSDLLTGTILPPEFEFAGLPYPLLPARQLWIRDPLRVYLEMYHMGAAADGRGRLDARFRVVPLENDGSVDRSREPLTLEVQLTPRARGPYRESFDMQLRDQEPGQYRLEVEITDRVLRQSRTRSVILELVR